MKEETRQHYLQESSLPPSSNFTDRVMDEIAAPQITSAPGSVKQNHWGFGIACALFLILGCVFATRWSGELSLAFQRSISPAYIQALSLGIAALGIHIYLGILRNLNSG
ncbi:MAG: hypothetical protein AAFQ98_05960 [Bacteroidota bacterium]